MKGITINKNGNFAEIDINSFFYSNDVIEDTKDEFKDICDLKINRENERVIINFSPKANISINTITYEFVNHLLANLKNRRGVM